MRGCPTEASAWLVFTNHEDFLKEENNGRQLEKKTKSRYRRASCARTLKEEELSRKIQHFVKNHNSPF